MYNTNFRFSFVIWINMVIIMFMFPFLYLLGVTYEDAMRFWREEFTKVMDGNQFEKRYSYNIQHSYGKTGKMQNYSAYGCMKIITGSVGPGEHHGCPFKHWDIAILKQKFSEYGLDSQG